MKEREIFRRETESVIEKKWIQLSDYVNFVSFVTNIKTEQSKLTGRFFAKYN